MNESSLHQALHKKLRAMKDRGEPIEFLKVWGAGQQRAGEPDWCICYYGRCVKLEGKVGLNKPTRLQAYRMHQWRRAGAIVGVFHSVDEALEILSEAKQPPENNPPSLKWRTGLEKSRKRF